LADATRLEKAAFLEGPFNKHIQAVLTYELWHTDFNNTAFGLACCCAKKCVTLVTRTRDKSYPKVFSSRSTSTGIVVNMPGLTIPPSQKRVLTDATNIAHNGVKSPPSAKKRKLNGSFPNGQFTSSPAGQGGFRSKMGSSQPKSHFETEVLEKMTQDISDLKRSNTERDQQWERPSLDDFDEKRDSLCFQQIEIEEGTLHGGQVTLKLFGVSEVCHRFERCATID
jgi:hypothetical protein